MEGVGIEFSSWSAALLLPSLAAIGDGIVAVALIAAYRNDPTSRSLAGFVGLLGLWNISLALRAVPEPTALHGAVANALLYSLIILPAAGLHAAIRMAALGRTEARVLISCGWCVAAVFVGLQALGWVFQDGSAYPGGQLAAAGPALPAFIVFLVGAALISLLLHLFQMRVAQDAETRVRSTFWVAGCALLVPLGCMNFLVNYGVPILPPGSAANLLVLLLCAAGAVRFRILTSDTPLLRAAAAAAVVAMVATPVAAGFGRAAAGQADSMSWMLIMLGALSGAITLQRSDWARHLADRGVGHLLFPHRKRMRANVWRFLDSRHLETGEDRVHQLLRAIVDAFGIPGAAVYRSGATDPVASVGDAPPVPTDTGSSRIALTGGRLILARHGAQTHLGGEENLLLRLLVAQLDAALDRQEAQEALHRRADEIEQLRARIAAYEAPPPEIEYAHVEVEGLIGTSRAIRAAIDLIAHAAPTDIPVLILGETGTGKELLARAVHNLSKRRDAHMVSVNCPAIPTELAESVLFGHERGSFTGANESHSGKFEAAHGGTLFFDEVADLPMNVQTKLLRVLQEHETQRLGSHRVFKLDLRIVAATNRNLREEVRMGRFREDLLYRLTGVEVHVPPLRDRPEDIPMLAAHFVHRSCAHYRREPLRISPDAMTVLCNHAWPGNVRELQHVIESVVVRCDGPIITTVHLEGTEDRGLARATCFDDGRLRDVIRDTKLKRVQAALIQAGGNQASAARSLGMSRSNLSRLLKRYSIDVEDVMRHARAGGGVAP